MNAYRIIFDYKGKERTRVLNATDVEGVKKSFFSKIKEDVKQAMHDFIKSNYLTNIKIIITGDKK